MHYYIVRSLLVSVHQSVNHLSIFMCPEKPRVPVTYMEQTHKLSVCLHPSVRLSVSMSAYSSLFSPHDCPSICPVRLLDSSSVSPSIGLVRRSVCLSLRLVVGLENLLLLLVHLITRICQPAEWSQLSSLVLLYCCTQ